jgi:hypothetical protein
MGNFNESEEKQKIRKLVMPDNQVPTSSVNRLAVPEKPADLKKYLKML